MMNASTTIRPWWLPAAASLLAIGTVVVCYTLSASAGYIPSCFPNFQGCTSISSSGRHGMAYFIFKGGMIPAAVMLGLFWPLCRLWLSANGHAGSKAVTSMVWLGVISAAFLILYAVFLGSKGDFYSLMRRFGVTIHFSFAALAQILLARELRKPGVAPERMPTWVPKTMLGFSSGLLFLGLISIPIGDVIPDEENTLIDTVEWNFGLLLFGWYVLAAIAWKKTGFQLSAANRHAG